MPGLFLQTAMRPAARRYWHRHATIAGEATLYIGTIPLILAFVGLVGDGRDRG